MIWTDELDTDVRLLQFATVYLMPVMEGEMRLIIGTTVNVLCVDGSYHRCPVVERSWGIPVVNQNMQSELQKSNLIICESITNILHKAGDRLSILDVVGEPLDSISSQDIF